MTDVQDQATEEVRPRHGRATGATGFMGARCLFGEDGCVEIGCHCPCHDQVDPGLYERTDTP